MKTINVELKGLTPLMMDAFRGQEEIPPEQKLYIAPDKKTVILPASNIVGFLTSKSSHSCLRVFSSNKDWKTRGPEMVGNVAVDPIEIPLLSEGKPVVFEGKFNEQVYLDERMARPSNTARVIARRPVISLPWELEFSLMVNETEFVTVSRLKDWFMRGGISVGIGAYRPMFGRFEVTFS